MIKVLIIEDEQPAAKRLEKLLLEVAPDLQIVQRCDSIESGVNYLKLAALPDLIMLDVQLGLIQVSLLDVVESSKALSKCLLVY